MPAPGASVAGCSQPRHSLPLVCPCAWTRRSRKSAFDPLDTQRVCSRQLLSKRTHGLLSAFCNPTCRSPAVSRPLIHPCAAIPSCSRRSTTRTFSAATRIRPTRPGQARHFPPLFPRCFPHAQNCAAVERHVCSLIALPDDIRCGCRCDAIFRALISLVSTSPHNLLHPHTTSTLASRPATRLHVRLSRIGGNAQLHDDETHACVQSAARNARSECL